MSSRPKATSKRESRTHPTRHEGSATTVVEPFSFIRTYMPHSLFDTLLNRRPGKSGPQRTEDIELTDPNKKPSSSYLERMVKGYKAYKEMNKPAPKKDR